MDNPHTGSTYTSNTVMGEFGVNDMICDGSSVCEPMVWFTMFLLLANFWTKLYDFNIYKGFFMQKIGPNLPDPEGKKIQNPTFLG